MQNTIYKFYFYRTFLSLMFFTSTSVIFMQARGLNFTSVMLVFSSHSATALLMEIPGGVFADTYGKKLSVVLGTLGVTLSLLLNAFSINFSHFVIAAVIGGIGWALISGADSAFLHGTLTSLDQKDEYTKVQGRSTGISRLANAAGALLGGFFYTIRITLPFFASAISACIAFFIALSFTKPVSKNNGSIKTFGFSIIKESFLLIKSHPQLLWLTILTSFFTAFVWSINVVIQPYMQLLGIPVVYFGVIFAGIALASAIASSFIHRFKKYHSEYHLLVLMSICAFVMIFMGIRASLLVFAFWVIVDISSAIIDTLVSTKVLNIVDEKKAATVLSFQSAGIRIINIISSPLIGIISDKYGLKTGLTVTGSGLLVVSMFLLLSKYRRT